MTKNYLSPSEILKETEIIGEAKGSSSFWKLVILGILAGAFIAFAAEGSNMAAFNLFAKPETYGLGKALAGVVFATGLMLVVVAGGELFTGNTLMVVAVFEKRITWRSMFRNWTVVYFANFIGAFLIAFMMVNSGLFACGGEMLGAVTIKIAVYKVNISFMSAIFLGIMCNWLVCLAVWMAYGCDTILGKLFAIFFPIWLFITSGFEHCIANMYYIPAGIMAKSNESFAALTGLSEEALSSLNWSTFITGNLIPVTIGNIIGGSIFVATAYWLSLRKISPK